MKNQKVIKLSAASAYGAEGGWNPAFTEDATGKHLNLDAFPRFKAAIKEFQESCRMGGTDLQIGIIDMRRFGDSESAKARTSGYFPIGAIYDDEVEAIYQEWLKRHPNYEEETASEHMNELKAGPRGEEDSRYMIAEHNAPTASSAESFAKELNPSKRLRTFIRGTAEKALKSQKCHYGVNLKRKTQAMLCDPYSYDVLGVDLLSYDRFKIILVVLFDDFADVAERAIDMKLAVSFKLSVDQATRVPYAERSHREKSESIYKYFCPKPYRNDNVYEASFNPKFANIINDWSPLLEGPTDIVDMRAGAAAFMFVDFKNITLSNVAKMFEDGYIEDMFADDDLEDFDDTYLVIDNDDFAAINGGSIKVAVDVFGRTKAKQLVHVTDALTFVTDNAPNAAYVALNTEVSGNLSDLYLLNSRASADDLIAAAIEIDKARKERFGITDEQMEKSREETESWDY